MKKRTKQQKQLTSLKRSEQVVTSVNSSSGAPTYSLPSTSTEKNALQPASSLLTSEELSFLSQDLMKTAAVTALCGGILLTLWWRGI
jgi:hypothetical protein